MRSPYESGWTFAANLVACAVSAPIAFIGVVSFAGAFGVTTETGGSGLGMAIIISLISLGMLCYAGLAFSLSWFFELFIPVKRRQR